MTLRGKRNFADVTKDLKMGRWSWIIWVAPMSSQGPYRGKKEVGESEEEMDNGGQSDELLLGDQELRNMDSL